MYVCSECGRTESKWLGRCPDCGSWNSFVEEVVQKGGKRGKTKLVSDTNKAQTVALKEVIIEDNFRLTTQISEFDRVLGGGIMKGATVLLGGEPGIGKSTIMLQLLASISTGSFLYVSAEESPSQVRLRGDRLELNLDNIELFSEGRLEPLLILLENNKYNVVVIDSLQTLYTNELPSAAGSVNQMRYCAMELVSLAKRVGFSLFLIGHITKEGHIAGPKVIEHLVDTVLYFEQAESDVRIIRAVKNRYGSVDEIGIFLMGEKGLIGVTDSANFFVSSRKEKSLPPGIAFTVVVEGSRAFMVEIQALVVPSKSNSPRLYSERIESSRVMRVAAVLERHGGVQLLDKDIYVNVAGGIKLSEVSIELPLALALYSAVSSNALPTYLVSFGEVSLAGEIRPVKYLEKRIKGATEMGLKKVVGPNLNIDNTTIKGVEVRRIDQVLEVVQHL